MPRPATSSSPEFQPGDRVDEGEKLGERFTDDDAVRLRRTRAGPILATLADWLDERRRHATPKSLFGQAIEYSQNQWSSLVRYLDDSRFAIGRVERWRGGLGQAQPLPALSSAGASLA